MSERSFENATGIQRRSSAELRTGTGDEFALVGYAAKYNSMSENLGGFRETLAPGCFSRALKSPTLDVKCLLNHAADNILGRTKSGTLRLFDTPIGLRFHCKLDPNNSDHKNLYSAVKREDLDQCSFAFSVGKGGQTWADGTDPKTGEACAMRTITDIDELLDVSVVTYPAYSSTDVSARNRSVIDAMKTRGLVEAMKILRRASQMTAAAMIKQYREKDCPAPYSYETVGEHLRIAHEFCEAGNAISQMAEDCLGGMEAAGARSKIFSAHDTFRGAQRTFHAATSIACEQAGVARLYLARCWDKK
jgi:HK97 family phage prohead protease